MQVSRRPLTVLLIALTLSACNSYTETPRSEIPEVSLTSAQLKDVTLTQQYVGHVNAHRHIEVRPPHSGIVTVTPKAGQAVKEGEVLFQLGTPPAALSIKAPFDGVVGRIKQQQGAFVEEGETLTTLSDNSEVRVYFQVPEVRYLEYHSNAADKDEVSFELMLPDGNKFHHQGELFAIAGNFDPKSGTITFRADFPNPEGQLRQGQNATVLISRPQEHALVVPQRATFQVAQRRYVYVVDGDDIARQRAIEVENEVDDLFVLKSGLKVDERIILDGLRQVLDGGKVQYHRPQANAAAPKLAAQTD
jgi:multidrug efflux pump subunit AcrA (membrane-fusion protein)